MLLAAEQVKELILHPHIAVRQLAAEYFSESRANHQDVADQVIRAIQQFGWDEAFSYYRMFDSLVLGPEALDWLLDQLTLGHVGQDDRLAGQISVAVAAADVELLAERHERLLDMPVFRAKLREAIEVRLALRTVPPEQLWTELTAWCERNDQCQEFPKDFDTLEHLCEALGRYPDFAAPRALERLGRPPRDPEDWLEIAAVRLAGELRLADAIQPIVDRITDSDDANFEATELALKRTGGDAVVAAMAAAFSEGDYGFKLLTASVLGTIHTETSVRTCLNLPLGEDDAVVVLQLSIATLSSFASEAIEPGRQLVLGSPHDPEVMEVRRRVVAVCLAHGVSIPELDAWAADVANDDLEFRQQLAAFRAESLRDEWDADGEEGEEARNDGAAEPRAPAETITRDHQRVGRNDSCPCGSGKKYKRCCLSKAKALS